MGRDGPPRLRTRRQPGHPFFQRFDAFFEQKIAKRYWNFAIKGKNRGCLEMWCEPTPVSSFPLRSSVKIAFLKTTARPAVAPYLFRQP